MGNSTAPAPLTDAGDPAALRRLIDRRSVAKLVGPAPDDDQVRLLLEAATTVPDHGELRPWRFVVVRDGGRDAFGAALAAAAREHDPQLPADRAAKIAAKPLIAPLLIALVATPRLEAKVQVWEQLASAACTGYAIVLAAHLSGFGAVWKSTSFQTGADLRRLFQMGEHDQLLGWVNVGRAGREMLPARARASVDEVASTLSDDGPLRALPATGA